MYKFQYFDSNIKSMLHKHKDFWDIELESELKLVLRELKESGEVEGAICGVKPGVLGLIYEIKGKTFNLVYTVDSDRKIVKFYELQYVSHEMDWKSALENDLESDYSRPTYITQIGDPHKLIKAIDLIYSGANTPLKLGLAFESDSKNPRYVARRGYYLGRPLEEFGLVFCEKRTKASCVYHLTPKGRLIAESKDTIIRERLMVEALLGFEPIQIIIERTTTKGSQELTKELIEEVIREVSRGDCGGKTSPRRAGSMRALINWVARWAAIPIRRPGSEGIQLYIPHIYAK